MPIQINKVKGGQAALEIVYAYEFNRESMSGHVKDPTKTMICFIIKDDGKEDLQEYYYNKEKPDILWWHNSFYAGTSFEKRLKAAGEGETFKYQKEAYLWRKLTATEINTITAGKIFIEEI